jgi:phage gp36-like protein
MGVIMPYVTNSDIEERLGTAAYIQLTDDTGTGSADLDKIEEARAGAEAEANSYFASRYKVPIDATGEPQVLAAIKCVVLDLIAYRLHGRRPPIPPDITRRRSEAIAWLAQVGLGVVHLPSAIPLAENSAGGLVIEVSGPARLMTRDSLRDV